MPEKNKNKNHKPQAVAQAETTETKKNFPLWRKITSIVSGTVAVASMSFLLMNALKTRGEDVQKSDLVETKVDQTPASGTHIYNEDMATADAVYAQQVAEFMYTFVRDAGDEKSMFKRMYEQEADDIIRTGIVLSFSDYKDKSLSLDSMVSVAKKQNKSHIAVVGVFQNQDYMIASPIGEIAALCAYKDAEFKAGGTKPPPLMLDMAMTRGSHMHLMRDNGKTAGKRLHVTGDVFSHFSRSVIQMIIKHEESHLHAADDLLKTKDMSLDVRGHDRAFTTEQKVGFMIENYADKGAAKEDFVNEKDVCGFAWYLYFNTMQGKYNADEPPQKLVTEMKHDILTIHRKEIENPDMTHPPTMYRILNVIKVANIDMTKYGKPALNP